MVVVALSLLDGVKRASSSSSKHLGQLLDCHLSFHSERGLVSCLSASSLLSDASMSFVFFSHRLLEGKKEPYASRTTINGSSTAVQKVHLQGRNGRKHHLLFFASLLWAISSTR
jgi:hypothetical protein